MKPVEQIPQNANPAILEPAPLGLATYSAPQQRLLLALLRAAKVADAQRAQARSRAA